MYYPLAKCWPRVTGRSWASQTALLVKKKPLGLMVFKGWGDSFVTRSFYAPTWQDSGEKMWWHLWTLETIMINDNVAKIEPYNMRKWEGKEEVEGGGGWVFFFGLPLAVLNCGVCAWQRQNRPTVTNTSGENRLCSSCYCCPSSSLSLRDLDRLGRVRRPLCGGDPCIYGSHLRSGSSAIAGM